jgi:sulfur-oxidizing protein SoxY
MDAGPQNASPTRRLILLAAAGFGLTSLAPPVAATSAAMEEAIRALTGEAAISRGRVKLELPPIVENGNTVPLTVSVESPMTEADYVASIHIFNQQNPQPYVAAFHLGPRRRAVVSARIRLPTRSGGGIALAGDGSFCPIALMSS